MVARGYLRTDSGQAMAIVDQLVADTLADSTWVDLEAIAQAIEDDRHVLLEAAMRVPGTVTLNPTIRTLVLSTLRTRARTQPHHLHDQEAM